MHWAGWTRENVRVPPGYATKARQIPAVVGSSVGAETAAWQQITQMAIVDFFASGTAMQIEAEGSWIIAGLAAQAERERERESWRHASTGRLWKRSQVGLTTCRYTLSLFLFSTADELLAPSKNPVPPPNNANGFPCAH
jgi:hypothetical protein